MCMRSMKKLFKFPKLVSSDPLTQFQIKGVEAAHNSGHNAGVVEAAPTLQLPPQQSGASVEVASSAAESVCI